MICTQEIYDGLLKFYYDNRGLLESLHRDDEVLMSLFLLKNLNWNKELITSVEQCIRNTTEVDVLETMTYDNFSMSNDEYALCCWVGEDDCLEDYINLTLKHESHYDGYCDCTADMEGFYEEYNCCGNGCDYSEPYFEDIYGIEYRIPNYREYMYFDFLREIHGQEVLHKNSEKIRLQNLVSHLERELEKAKKQLTEV